MTTEKMGPIRCHVGRAGRYPCEEPATVEIRGPVSKLMCAEHARAYLEDMPGERWQEYGAQSPVEYARFCEEAADTLYGWMEPGVNGVLYDALAEAYTYLEVHALPPAREVLVRAGEAPRPTRAEIERVELWREWAGRYGWTERPPLVELVESWLAHHEAASEGSKA